MELCALAKHAVQTPCGRRLLFAFRVYFRSA